MAAAAQWPTNWPDGYFQGRSRALCVYSALTERVVAANNGVDAPEFPQFFTQRARLISYKAKAKELCDSGYFVDLAGTNADGSFSGIYTNTDGDMQLPYLRWTTACIRAGVTTNYAGATPFFQLNSDTNYGWPPFKAVLNQMIATRVNSGSGQPDGETRYILTNGFNVTSGDWTDLSAQFTTHYGDANNWQAFTSSIGYEAFSTTFNITSNSTDWNINCPVSPSTYNWRGVVALRGLPTNMNSSAHVYVMAYTLIFPVSWSREYANIWTVAVDAYPTLYRYDSMPATNTATRYSRMLPFTGAEIDLQLPASAPDRTYAPSQRFASHNDDRRTDAILFWNVANGFRYVE
jgi:hypothetical protein